MSLQCLIPTDLSPISLKRRTIRETLVISPLAFKAGHCPKGFTQLCQDGLEYQQHKIWPNETALKQNHISDKFNNEPNFPSHSGKAKRKSRYQSIGIGRLKLMYRLHHASIMRYVYNTSNLLDQIYSKQSIGLLQAIKH